jgi:hypothetical protein
LKAPAARPPRGFALNGHEKCLQIRCEGPTALRPSEVAPEPACRRLRGHNDTLDVFHPQEQRKSPVASGKILVAQGGGPTAVINQSLVGVVLEARRRHKGIDRVYGARHGVRGIVNEDFVDLTQETSHNLELVAATPGLGPGFHPRQARSWPTATKIFQVLQAHGIGHFFYIGGNDSSDTVRIVSQQARRPPATRCAASTSPRPSTTIWSATTTRRASPARRVSWRRPLPAPTWTTRRCRACTWRGDGPPCGLPDGRLARWARSSPTTART